MLDGLDPSCFHTPSPIDIDRYEEVIQDQYHSIPEQDIAIEHQLSTGLPWLHLFLQTENAERRVGLLQVVEERTGEGIRHVKRESAQRLERHDNPFIHLFKSVTLEV